jgi:ubiquitin carboxyl-terminal hydrolase 25/28
VHDGNANHGHYYAFIKDRFNNKWRRFSDIRVSEVTEEEVMRESNGGHAWQTAFFVIYISPRIANELKDFDIYGYTQPEKRDANNYVDAHLYANMVPGIINMQVEEENLKLRDAIVDHKATNMVKEIQKAYDERYNEINQIWTVYQEIPEIVDKELRRKKYTPETAYLEHVKASNLLLYLAD